MNAYRLPPASLSLPRPTPWYRIIRAWATGSLSRIEFAQKRRNYERQRRLLDRRVNGVDIDADRDEQIRLGMLIAPVILIHMMKKDVYSKICLF